VEAGKNTTSTFQEIKSVGILLTLDSTGFYVETNSHRNHYCKLFVAFNSRDVIAIVMLHNLLGPELEFIHNRLNEAALHPLTIHPMFVMVLLMQLPFNEAQAEARVVFRNSVHLQHGGNLHTNDRFKHLVEQNVNIEQAAVEALGNEQRILVLLEKMGFAIKRGEKVLSWFNDLKVTSPIEEQQTRFNTAGEII
jgi:hypothetical protein